MKVSYIKRVVHEIHPNHLNENHIVTKIFSTKRGWKKYLHILDGKCLEYYSQPNCQENVRMIQD